MMDVGFLYLTGILIGRVGFPVGGATTGFTGAAAGATGFGVTAVGAVFPFGI
jgi:hypothetical protein